MSVSWRILLTVVVFQLNGGGVLGAEAALPVATPESQGVRSEVLRELSEYVRAEKHDVRSLVLLRHGKLVFEWYAGGVSRDHNHNVFSVTKSVVATLSGIAIDEGAIQGPHATLGELFPDRPGLADDTVKAGIPLDALLTMRSGLPVSRGNQPSGPEKELFDRVHRAPDRTALILDELDVPGTPGARFIYSNIDPQLTLAAIEERTGERGLAFAKRTLFDPMGFENAAWVFADPSGRVPGGYGVRLRAIDMAKLGQLYLQGGRWGDQQIVSAAWIDSARKNLTGGKGGGGYGYYWWVDAQSGAYAARGVRGQRIEVYPALDLVFVVTADLPPEKVNAVLRVLSRDYVLKAVGADGALPGNPAAYERLTQEIERARRYTPESRKGLPASRLPRD